MLVAIRGEALKIVLEEKEAVKGWIAALHLDVPRQYHHEVEHDAGDPNGAPQQRPLTPQRREQQDDGKR